MTERTAEQTNDRTNSRTNGASDWNGYLSTSFMVHADDDDDTTLIIYSIDAALEQNFFLPCGSGIARNELIREWCDT
jgi:hypothetical protein